MNRETIRKIQECYDMCHLIESCIDDNMYCTEAIAEMFPFISISNKAMKKLSKKFVLLKEIIIPAGTVLDRTSNELGGESAVEAFVAMGKDSTARLLMNIDAIEDAPSDLITELK